jgi:translocation and assembly module TamB
MPEEEIEQTEQNAEGQPTEQPPAPRRRRFTRKHAGISGGALAIILVLLAIFAVVFYRYGVFDNYIKAQFVAKMAYMGMDFDADVFRITVAPIELELKNATFNDRVTGEKLFFIRDAHLGITIDNLYAWQISRDITVNSTDINGAQVWVKFDENGKSNFSNLVVDTRASNLNFKYNSIKFALKDSVVHFGDVSHKIDADANNVSLFLEPENYEVPDEQKRYKFDLTSKDSLFVYDDSKLEEIDIHAKGIADGKGAEISELTIETPIGVSNLNGTLTDWASLKYNLNIESTVDLTQTTSIFPLGASIHGVGNFKGNVTGEGDKYKVDGVIDSQALSAEGIYLKGVNVAATVEGTNSMYEANGKAIAELLTFEDFRIDFPKIAGNVRGTGTDFRWVGELQAAAAKSKSLTLGGLFLSDAVAEYKDKQLTGSAGNGRAQKFSVADAEFAKLQANNLKFSRVNGTTNLSAPNARADSFTTKDYQLQGLNGNNIRVKDTKGRTDVNVDKVQAQGATVKGTKLKNLTADDFALLDLPNSTDLTAKNVRAAQLDANGTHVAGLDAASVTVHDTNADTVIYSDSLRVAKLEAGGATLGSLNIAGVRLTIKQGRIEGTSKDIDAGTVTLAKSSTLAEGGTFENVKIAKPVFVVEPSGHYRATADMSLGGGVIGNIPLGAAQAKVNVNNDRVELTALTANVMDGSVEGNAVIAFNNRNQSHLAGTFSGLDLSKLIAIQGGRVIPLEGKTAGNLDITFNGTDFKTASGNINADIAANAGNADSGLVPVNGNIRLSAVNGLFNVDNAVLNTDKSKLTATGRFDLRSEDSNLDIALNSTDAGEIDRLVRVLGIAPELEQQFDSMEMQFAGNLNFTGKLTGNLTDPTIDGKADLASLVMRGRDVGSVTTDIFVSPVGVELRNGKLLDRTGGDVSFSINVPSGGANNVSVQATLTNVNAGNLLAALPVTLPERIQDFTGQTSGTVNLSGLPNQATGEINIASAAGTVAEQPFDSLKVRAVFSGTLIDLQSGEIRVGDGFVSAKGTYDRASSAFNFDLEGKNVPVPLALSFLPKSTSVPTVAGFADFTAKATGESDRASTYNINFDGSARDVVINDTAVGAVTFKGNTAGQVLNAELTAVLGSERQVITGSIDFGKENMPLRAVYVLNNSSLGPFFALVPQLRGIAISGSGTGSLEFGGSLRKTDANGEWIFTSETLTGTANFSALALSIEDTPLVATRPVIVTFSPQGITFESAHFSGGGSNLTIAGTKALTDAGVNSLSLDGRINLSLLNVFKPVKESDLFFGGLADVAVRVTGPNSDVTLSGTANLANASVATFIGSDRLTFDRVNGRILFSSGGAQIIDQATGYLGGGRFVASGEALFTDNLNIRSFRLGITGTNITVPLPEDFITTGDAKLEITGRRSPPTEQNPMGGNLSILIAGNILARRSLYTEDIELANIVGARREGSLSGGASSIRAPRFDLTIEGRDALVIRNNIADLTASASLRLTGNTNNPQISGRIVANSGTVFFRKDRYIVQRGVLEFPPDTAIEPVINLQAESEIAGYQVFVNLSGPLTDTENLNATVRSSPALPQADVISLITTGNLSNTESGIPTLAQTGINTAAEILTDSIINNPARKATDKLFGLNVFEIDPIISGERLNPSARLTVGRQINNNLRVTYATNLSQDQNQVLALEYRVSNKMSVVAQYEQRSLSNVTRNRDNFSIEIRFRRRF